MLIAIVLEGFVILLLAMLVAGLLRSHAEILRTLHAEGIGEDGRIGHPTPNLNLHDGVASPRTTDTPGHDIVGVKTDGSSRSISVVGAEHTTLLAFLSSTCSTCQGFWEAFSVSDNLDLPGRNTRLVVVTKGPAAESESKLRQLAPRHFPVVMSSEAWDQYDVPVSPYFILIDGPSGKVMGEGAAVAWDQVKSLLTQATDDQAIRSEAASGSTTATSEPRIDAELQASGIEHGHASLRPEKLE